VFRPTPLPWARPRYELLLLALVAVATLSSVYVVSTQDVTRLCLTQALRSGHLTIQPCAGNTIDQASYNNHNYTDKAPGLSVLAVPAAVVTRLPTASAWTFEGDPHLWAVRLLTSGIAFLLLAFAVGRVSEGIAPGYGSAALVTFALATYVAPLAASTFDHVLAGAFAFGAFVLAWSGRYGLAGLMAGIAATTNYTTGLVAIVLAVYVLLAGVRPLLRYAIGALPPLALLGAYNWAAFGSPFHLSYRYVANQYAGDQASGFFGINVPHLHGTGQVFLGDRGLLVASPVVVAAAAGLVLLARTHRREAITCGVVFALLLLANCGYFKPYGGISPGPRFLVPALPFLALGLAPAFARWRLVTSALAAVSIVAMTTLTLTWAETLDFNYRQTVWGELVRFLKERGSSRLVSILTKNAIVWAGPNRLVAAAVVCACAVGAFVLALRTTARR
jgi:hydrogenase-4 membrane subunit HyfE